MNKPQLIALYSSRPRSGKSSIARRLCAEHDFEPMKFAAPIKAMMRALLLHVGLDRAEIDERLEGDRRADVIPQLGVSARMLMQTLGTDWGRDMIASDIWLDIARRKIESNLADGASVVLDDMRFANEKSMIEQLGGTCVRVERKNHGAVESNEHASEDNLSHLSFDWSLELEEGVEALNDAADALAEEIRVRDGGANESEAEPISSLGLASCEVCRDHAKHFVADVRECAPTNGFRHYALHSRHAFCEAHLRPSLLYMLDESVEIAELIE